MQQYENQRNPFSNRREAISPWEKVAIERVDENEEVLLFAEKLYSKNIKTYDALHIACAVFAGCRYFLTTDKKLLNSHINEIRIINPIDFVREMED